MMKRLLLASLVTGAVCVPVFGQVNLEERVVRESSLSDTVKAAFAAHGDLDLVTIDPGHANVGFGGEAVLQEHAALLGKVAESVARLSEFQKLTAQQASWYLVTLSNDGADLVASGKAVADYFQRELEALEASESAAIFIERHRDAMEAQLANQEILDSLLTRFRESSSGQLLEDRDEALALLHDWFLINPVEPRLRLSFEDVPENPSFRYLLPETLDLAEVGLDDRGFVIPKGKKEIGGTIGTKDLPPASGLPTAADLGSSIETIRTLAIEELASSLDHSPLKIFNWVRNHIEFDAYVGSRRGAAETLRLRAGNDTDQAALLIALLRSAGVPCRYATGVGSISAKAAVNWTGAGSAVPAASLLTTAGMEGVAIYEGAEVGAVQMRRVWVEAYVPYSKYRGGGDESGEKLWVPLDPAFKEYRNEMGEDFVTTGGILVDDFLSEYFARSGLVMSPV